ncbi:MAG: response regulator [Patescibacteria group bacterium]|nr:response regulator [Patescibacteria group bacterium]
MEKKILICEDDAMIGGMYKTKLEQEGYVVLLADNGASGLSMALSQKPDLILLDIIMPQLDGFSVLQELRSSAKTKKTPVIMLTNLSTDEDKKKGDQFGATDYLVKANLTPSQVGEAIKKYLK